MLPFLPLEYLSDPNINQVVCLTMPRAKEKKYLWEMGTSTVMEWQETQKLLVSTKKIKEKLFTAILDNLCPKLSKDS